MPPINAAGSTVMLLFVRLTFSPMPLKPAHAPASKDVILLSVMSRCLRPQTRPIRVDELNITLLATRRTGNLQVHDTSWSRTRREDIRWNALDIVAREDYPPEVRVQEESIHW